jgi:hypothetical protein
MVFALVLLAACWSYDDPNYNFYEFRCDDTHGCPKGQSCKSGLCQFQASTYDGVICGASHCEDGDQCCFADGMTRCLAATESCSGTDSIAARCDGLEDCPQGTTCCAGVIQAAACRQGDTCSDRLCLDSTDCGGNYCCPDTFNTSSPFKLCSSDPCN